MALADIHRLDATDGHILELLQTDGRMPQRDIARAVGLSAPAVSERLKKLETAGVIRGYVALLNDEFVGADVKAFVEVYIDKPSNEKAFLKAIRQVEEVLECHHVTGEASLLLKLATHDRASLKSILLDRINGLPGVWRTKSVLVLATVKEHSKLPLSALLQTSQS